MAYQLVFKRHEIKYLISEEQKSRILHAMSPYMALDQYGRTTIRNLYFDNDSYRLIRRSMEKPLYKEKLRLRSYARAKWDSTVFVEIKKKYKKVVYKRRISMREQEAMRWLSGAAQCSDDSQISREIDYFLSFYGNLHPAMYICYDREAFYSRDGSDFRVTFDDRILCRREELTLDSEPYGTPILEEGMVMMEIKCSGGIPLWMTEVLSREKIYKTSFSKYGKAYEKLIFPNHKEELKYGSFVSRIV